MKISHNEYKAILRRSPDIGGSKNIFMGSYIMGAYLVSLYKNTRDNLRSDDWDLIVSEGRSISEEIEKDLRREFNISQAIIHVEPC